ncbi:MAG: vitamin B12-dependent ribonucleotide reductase [candidate division WOR-3 bacterium]|nr:vitamin B12-dependent ribonucleotide reductase [candidate division WOR-3 bacterium]
MDRVSLSANALEVLRRRYLRRDEQGNIVETPEAMFLRVAKTIAEVDAQYGAPASAVDRLTEEFYQLMSTLLFLPNSPTLMNAGTELGQLSACFVLPVGDSMEEIFDAVKFAALIHKSGGGTGFSFSRLRPKGDVVGSTKGVSSGPLSFMSVFDAATEAVKQGGRRRGANMGLLRVDHPDIQEFITCKDDPNRFTNFNISVGVTEEFMRAVIEDRDYALINPRSREVVQRLRAQEVFNLIVHQAWKNGEPGIVFLDRVNAANPVPAEGEIEATNPCGEQPLLPYESCNLGSINLARMVKDGAVDWELLGQVVHKAVHFLDNVIDANRYPLPVIAEKTRRNRKIGLGVMGWADMLAQLGIPYNAPEALQLAEAVMKFIFEQGKKASHHLAKSRGVFPNFEKSVYYPDEELRNATITTIAPTGSLSIIAGCSSGIEPYFALAFERNILDGTRLKEVNPYLAAELKKRGIWNQTVEQALLAEGKVTNIPDVPDDVKPRFLTALELTPEEHIRMQAAFQRYVHNAVSKTVNLANSACEDDVRRVFLLAYELGCKGVTVYRDGSRAAQVLSVKSPAAAVKPRGRAHLLTGVTRKMATGCGNLYVTINRDESGRLFEVFTNIGKAGVCAQAQAEAIGRLVSLILRSGVDPRQIVKQLKGISCQSPAWSKNEKITSCADAIAKALEQELGEVVEVEKNNEGACPDCGGRVEFQEGCLVCVSCGFSKCP